MNRYIVISLVILAFLGGIYFTQLREAVPIPRLVTDTATTTPEQATTTAQAPQSPAAKPTAGTTATPKAPAPKGTQTYKSLVTQMGNYRCDVEQVSGSSRTDAVVYVSDGKMHVELRPVGAAGTIAVYDGRYLYSWTEGMASGIKTQPSSLSQLPFILPANLNTRTTLSSGGSSFTWNCRTWTRDAALFSAPAYVTFKSQ
ncbi:hypothetical protein FJY94_00930 [Candidatus Kaiserbacteria bacterium]|nr:hypothetical protein [Candidatus Kaiserbacteria bacterium]